MEINLVIQAKGGAGKSFLTAIFALSRSNTSALFVDLDSSSHTSHRQILPILGDGRVEAVSLLDAREMLVRDRLIGYLERLSQSNADEVFIDFGAAESQMLTYLIVKDLPFKAFCDELNLVVSFNVVIAGGGSYKASVSYLQEVYKAANGDFSITAWANLYTFSQFPQLLAELIENCRKLKIIYKSFGDLDSSSLLGAQITDGIRQGFTLSQYPVGARLRLQKELKQNFNNE